MSRFFVQILLSVLIGLGAAVGFSQSLGMQAHDTWYETKALVREMTRTTIAAVGDTMSRVKAIVSIKADVKDSSNDSVELNTKAKGALEAQAANGSRPLDDVPSTTSTNSSFTVDSRTKAPNLNLLNKTDSRLDLSLNPGQ